MSKAIGHYTFPYNSSLLATAVKLLAGNLEYCTRANVCARFRFVTAELSLICYSGRSISLMVDVIAEVE